MFKNLQRELDRLSRSQQISVPIKTDPEGFLDKECPSEPCLFTFKVHGEDWAVVGDRGEVFCPSCGHTAPSNSWYTRAQVKAAREYALGTVTNSMNRAMRADAAASKRSRRANSFLSVTLDVKGGRDAVLVPIAAAEPLRLRAQCERCECRYSFLGAAYFCPRCGTNSASHTFEQTLRSIRTAANVGDTLRDALQADDAAVIVRALLEKAIQDTVMSFQRLNEQLYENQTGRSAKRNAFQRLDAGSDLWKELTGFEYSDLVSAADLARLKLHFQRRHLLAHQQGIVDSDYLARSGDTSYREGQRLVIAEADVLEFANLVEKLGNAIRGRIAPTS